MDKNNNHPIRKYKQHITMKIFTTIASALLLALAGCTSNTKSYDVCSFGATGDGTTDDAAAIQ